MFGVACHNMSSAFSVFCVVRAQLIVLNSSSIPPACIVGLLASIAWAQVTIEFCDMKCAEI